MVSADLKRVGGLFGALLLAFNPGPVCAVTWPEKCDYESLRIEDQRSHEEYVKVLLWILETSPKGAMDAVKRIPSPSRDAVICIQHFVPEPYCIVIRRDKE